jgi:hypothetical protein
MQPAFVLPAAGLKRQLFAALVTAFTLISGSGVSADPATVPDDEATLLGQRVLAVQAALQDPAAPGSMEAVEDLGLDSRYYVMVRGWLSLQLTGDRGIAASRQQARVRSARRSRSALHLSSRRSGQSI